MNDQSRVYYRKAWKYRLDRRYVHRLQFIPSFHWGTVPDPDDSAKKSVSIRARTLTLHRRFTSDGPSGPTFDTPDSMRAAFVHDALYALIREGVLGEENRKYADLEFLAILKEDGMPWIRRLLWYLAVRCFAGRYCRKNVWEV